MTINAIDYIFLDDPMRIELAVNRAGTAREPGAFGRLLTDFEQKIHVALAPLSPRWTQCKITLYVDARDAELDLFENENEKNKNMDLIAACLAPIVSKFYSDFFDYLSQKRKVVIMYKDKKKQSESYIFNLSDGDKL